MIHKLPKRSHGRRRSDTWAWVRILLANALQIRKLLLASIAIATPIVSLMWGVDIGQKSNETYNRNRQSVETIDQLHRHEGCYRR